MRATSLWLLVVIASFASPLGGCLRDDGAAGGEGGRLRVDVAPLSLAGVAAADYVLTVRRGSGGAGDVVWTKAVGSADYGDGAGSLAYVGTCDASAAKNTVTLDLVALYDADGAVIPASSYRNPTPISVEADCLPNQDSPVAFDLTIARQADQGFFDVAVELDTIFCSAKLDCVNAATGGDLELLIDPVSGKRDLTAVLGFACAGAPGGPTWLYMDDVTVRCSGLAPATVHVEVGGLGNVALDGPGNANPGSYLFAAQVNRGRGAQQGMAYWNVALGLREGAFGAAGDCTLEARATAGSTAFGQIPGGFAVPEGRVYPVVTWAVPLSTTAAGRVCAADAVNAAGSHVTTEYEGYRLPNAFTWSPSPVTLRHRFDAATLALESACGVECPLEQCGDDGVCADPSCTDFRKNGDETGVDCGGSCGLCPDGEGCGGDGDCQSAVCGGDGTCSAPACDDGVENGDETAQDCGGACPPCADGDACALGGDCVSGVCDGTLHCAAPTCGDGVENGDETDQDCGGACPTCPDGDACEVAGDCASGVCDGTLHCAVPTCGDGVANGGESGVDCGGGVCALCADGFGCGAGSDCVSGACGAGGVCTAPACDDGVHNGDETGVDCGGPTCGACDLGQLCDTVTDCLSGFCGPGDDGTCATSVCTAGAPDANQAVRTCVAAGASLYEVRIFRTVGAGSAFVAPAGVATVETLIVAGGGAAGGSIGGSGGGGGGGAGGLFYRAAQAVTGGTSYPITIGGGGVPVYATTGGKGGNTTAFGLTALGGGGGGAGYGGAAATSGGSGGGAGYNAYGVVSGATGTAPQGYAGGNNTNPNGNRGSNYAAGGGGAGGVGQNQVAIPIGCGSPSGCTASGGLGGPGIAYGITGFAVTYAKGGDGSISAATDSAAGAAGTGTGGNGSYAAANGGYGGAGGSGVVIVRFLLP